MMLAATEMEDCMPIAENRVRLKLDQIVLATDFTSTSEAATNYTRSLAGHFSAATTVAHVLNLSIAARSEASMAGWPIDEMRRNCAEKMESTLNGFICRSLNVRGQTLESFHPALAIVDLADQINADLIVMGTHSRHGLSKVINGSFADGVIHHATCPVITLGPKARRSSMEELNLKTILLATDLKHDANQKVAKAFALAQESAARVYICHVVEEGGKDCPDKGCIPVGIELALRDFLPDSTFERTPECIIGFGDVGEHVLAFANKKGADLIILGARRGGSYFSHWNKGVVSAVLAEAECPVMTICAD
jgi:nucleotide-binding universal stress UspA family protein